MTYRHAILNRRAKLDSVTPQWATASDMNACRTEVSAGSQQGDSGSRDRRTISEEKIERRVTHANMHVPSRQWYASHQTRASRIWRGTNNDSLRNTAIAFDNEGA
jgi:hypothetical protein